MTEQVERLIERLKDDRHPQKATCSVTGATFRPIKSVSALYAERREAATLIESLSSQLAEARGALEEATLLAKSLHRKHFPEVTQWQPLPDLMGVLSQIDNMTTALERAKP